MTTPHLAAPLIRPDPVPDDPFRPAGLAHLRPRVAPSVASYVGVIWGGPTIPPEEATSPDPSAPDR